MAYFPDNGLVPLRSPYSILETLHRLESILQSRGLTVFARVDHSGEATKVGLKMHSAQLILFGSPKGGTPVMVASPTVAIDLPIKALIWEDAEGKVWLFYNRPEYLQQPHNIPDGLVKNTARAPVYKTDLPMVLTPLWNVAIVSGPLSLLLSTINIQMGRPKNPLSPPMPPRPNRPRHPSLTIPFQSLPSCKKLQLNLAMIAPAARVYSKAEGMYN